MQSVDIAKGFISKNDIETTLFRIFSDAIILNSQFEIVAVSEQIASMLGYFRTELIGKSIQQLSANPSTIDVLKKELAKGVFDNLVLPLKLGTSVTIPYTISGFYTGLFSDINGITILKISHQEETKLLNKHLELSRNELDEFVYRTTHDLRGPLATMLGLINLMKLDYSSITTDMKDLVCLLDTQARILDNRLYSLSHLSETSEPKAVNCQLDCGELESIMRTTLEQNLAINNVDFQFISNQRYFNSINSQIATALLNYLLLYLIELPRINEPRLSFSIARISSGMRVTIFSEGFLSNFHIKQALSQKDSVYTTVIIYSELVNFFAALKNAKRLGATVNVDFQYETSQQISVFVPWN